MCGRINVHDNEGLRLLLGSLGAMTWPSRDPRYNVAPTQTLDVVISDKNPQLVNMSWGVSMTIKGKKGQPITKRIPNAREDKLWSSYLWSRLIPSQRVLVPVSGFYEWRREAGKPVQAYYIKPANNEAMFFAGIYKTQADGKSELSIITTTANEAMSYIHDRMPVILSSPNEAQAWLLEEEKQTLIELMQPADNHYLSFIRVSDFVNKSSNEGPACINAL